MKNPKSPLGRLARMFLGMCLAVSLRAAEEPASAPDLDEVMNLLRTHLDDVDPQDLNAAAVRGVLEQFPDRVQLLDRVPDDEPPLTPSPIGRTRVFPGQFAYVQVAEVNGDLPARLAAGIAEFGAPQRIEGLILDLRFAKGRDFEAAGRTADLFLTDERLLVSWQTNQIQSTAKAEATRVPMAVLTNGESQGAAEVLAAVLRETAVGLLVGNPTAGQARAYEDYGLSNGQNLRIAGPPVRVGTNLSLQHPIEPDILIETSLEAERTYLEDPFQTLPETGTAEIGDAEPDRSAPGRPRPRLTEADLVRMQRNLTNPASSGAPREAPVSGLEGPHLRDPVLVRALDLLKGIAVLNRFRQP